MITFDLPYCGRCGSPADSFDVRSVTSVSLDLNTDGLLTGKYATRRDEPLRPLGVGDLFTVECSAGHGWLVTVEEVAR